MARQRVAGVRGHIGIPRPWMRFGAGYVKAEIAHLYLEVDPDLDAASSNSSGDIDAR